MLLIRTRKGELSSHDINLQKPCFENVNWKILSQCTKDKILVFGCKSFHMMKQSRRPLIGTSPNFTNWSLLYQSIVCFSKHSQNTIRVSLNRFSTCQENCCKNINNMLIFRLDVQNIRLEDYVLIWHLILYALIHTRYDIIHQSSIMTL